MSGAPTLPREQLSPTAAHVDRALAAYGYELAPAMAAIDDAVPGFGGLFHPDTPAADLRAAAETVADDASRGVGTADRSADGPSELVVYVDGSSRGNPGPAGAGAVVRADGEDLLRLGRPVGSNAGNNLAEYAALQLGVDAVVTRYGPARLDVRIDSMTVIDDVWRSRSPSASFAPYGGAVAELLSAVPDHGWTHLSDDDPNPADARATVGADVAALD